MPREIQRVSIEPAVLKWARESIGLSVFDVARKLGRKPEKVLLWESGEEGLPVRTLEALADIYKRTVATLLLETPPPSTALPLNFRKLPDGDVVPFSPATLLAVRRARYLQSCIRDLLLDDAAPSKLLAESFDTNSNTETQAEWLRGLLQYEIAAVYKLSSDRDAYGLRRQLLEQSGVYTLQMTMPVEEARGFSLLDKVAPVVVVNSADSLNARSFTLFHEMGHLLFHHQGICLFNGEAKEEIACNRLAAETLVPKHIILQNTEKWKPRDFESENNVAIIAQRFRVSREMMLRRFVELGTASSAFYLEMRAKWTKEAQEHAKKKSTGGPAPAIKSVSARGLKFTSLVVDALAQGRIEQHQASELMDVRVGEVAEVINVLKGRA